MKSRATRSVQTFLATLIVCFAASFNTAHAQGFGGQTMVPEPDPAPIYATTERALAPPAPGSYIDTKLSAAILDRAGDFEQKATCDAGQQLLGGGYMHSGSAPHVYRVSVRSNYPSSEDTWTAVFHSDIAPQTSSSIPGVPPFRDVLVAAYAYCLSAPRDFSLGLVRVAADNSALPKDLVVTNRGWEGVSQSWSVDCPPGSVLTGGGFAVEGPSQSNDATHNTDIRESTVKVDDTGVGRGWRVAITAFRPDTVRLTRAFAVCATKRLSALPAAQLSRKLTAGAAAQEHELRTSCEQGITTAGGVTYDGDALIPHPVFSSFAAQQFSSWDNLMFGAYQTTRYPKSRPCDPQTQACLEGVGAAACYEPPKIPYINVRIVSPPDSYHFPTGTRSSALTNKIVFTAKVFDENDNPINDADVVWSYADSSGTTTEFEKGDVAIARLPAGQSLSTLGLRAVAKVRRFGISSGLLVSQDSIKVTTGTVP